MGRYDYNRIFISDSEQETIRNCKVFIGGAASGSVIAECALRLGFEKMTVVDNSNVQLSDLNRHNFTMEDIGHSKAEAVGRRLLSINPDADIRIVNQIINKDNAAALLEGHTVAVNAIDITTESRSETNLAFDHVCESMNIPVIHPYNIGYASLVVVVKPGKPRLVTLKEENKATEERFERSVVEYVDRYFKENVYPVLTPMAVDSSRPFPLVRNKTLNIAALVKKKGGEDDTLDFAMVQVPSVIPRLVEIPEETISEKNASDAVVAKALEKEGSAILAAVPKGASIIALSSPNRAAEKSFSTAEFWHLQSGLGADLGLHLSMRP